MIDECLDLSFLLKEGASMRRAIRWFVALIFLTVLGAPAFGQTTIESVQHGSKDNGSTSTSSVAVTLKRTR
jgi:hypothetical protein